MTTSSSITSSVLYSGFTTDLTPHPVKRDITLLTNDAAVKRSVRNLILTNFYERPYNPNLGSGLRHLLFEPATPVTIDAIRNQIINCIANHEKRAILIDVSVSADLDSGDISAVITFGINNKANPITLTLALDRVR